MCYERIPLNSKTSSSFTWVAEGAQAIEAVTPRLGMTLLRRQNEVLVLAPTYLPACMLQYRVIAEEGLQFVKSLRANNTMLIIEEIGIVSSKLLHSINLQFNVMEDLDCDSTAVFWRLTCRDCPPWFSPIHSCVLFHRNAFFLNSSLRHIPWPHVYQPTPGARVCDRECLGTATPRRHLSAIATPRKSECCHRVYQHSSFFSKYYSEI